MSSPNFNVKESEAEAIDEFFDHATHLNKLGGKGKSSWRNRTVGVSAKWRRLWYFKTETALAKFAVSKGAEEVYSGFLSLRNARVYEADYMERANCFELSTSSKSMIFSADSVTQYEDWLTFLTTQCGVTYRSPKPEHFEEKHNMMIAKKDACKYGPNVEFSKQGYLEKASLHNKEFSPRFCRVQELAAGNYALVYYTKPADDAYRGIVSLDKQGVRIEVLGWDELRFNLLTRKRVYEFATETAEERNIWIKTIEYAIDACNYESGDEPEDSDDESADLGKGTHYDALNVPNDASEEEILGAFKKLTNELPQEQKSDENKDLKNLLSVSKAYDVLSNSNTRKKYDKRVLNKAVRRASQQFIKGSFRAMSNEEKARNLGDAAEVDQDVDLKSDDTDEHSTDEEALGEEERMRSIKIKEKLNEKMEFTHLNIKRQKTFKINVWFPETLDFIAYSAGPVDVKLIKIQKIKKVTVGRPPHQVKKKVLGQLTPEWFICVYGVDDEDSLFLIAKDETQRDDWIHMLCWALKEHDNPITPTGVAVPLDLRHEDVLNRRKSTFHRRGQRSSLGKVLPIDVFEKLREGRPFVRVPRHGKPKECNVFLSMSVTGDYTLRWDSSTKRLTECTVNLHDCRLFLGQKTKVFMKHKKKLKQYESTSFSLLNTERSVDLYTTSEETYTMLVSVLKELAKYNPSSVDATL